LIERRYLPACELRAKSAGGLTITGHAAVFDKLSDEIYGFRERIAPGAFAETIEKDDIRALWNHDANFVLGRNKAGTLKLAEDDIGLAIEAELPDTTFARDLMKSIERGDVSQMSFGFVTPPSGDDWRMENGQVIRTLNKVQLFDVSPVTYPAYPQTDVSARSLFAERIKALSAATQPDNFYRRKLLHRRIELFADY